VDSPHMTSLSFLVMSSFSNPPTESVLKVIPERLIRLLTACWTTVHNDSLCQRLLSPGKTALIFL